MKNEEERGKEKPTTILAYIIFGLIVFLILAFLLMNQPVLSLDQKPTAFELQVQALCDAGQKCLVGTSADGTPARLCMTNATEEEFANATRAWLETNQNAELLQNATRAC